MGVRLSDLPKDVRDKVAARVGSLPPSPSPSSRKRKEPGLRVFCHACGEDCSTETKQARHTKNVGHHRYEAQL